MSTSRTAATRATILDAALRVLATTTLSRLSLEAVAAAAGVSRQTLYRYFGSRDGLIEEVVVREEQRLMSELAAAAEDSDGLRETLSATVTRLLEWTRDHPLLTRLLAEDPDVLVPLLTTGSGPVLAVAQPLAVSILESKLPAGRDAGGPAEILTRLMISFAVNPPAEPPEVVAETVAGVLVDGLAGPTTPGQPA